MTEPGRRLTVAEVVARVAHVRERLAAAGGAHVKLVAVTKGFPVDVARVALEAGLVDLGENYAQDLLSKVETLAGAAARWHFIGRVQRKKVRQLAGHVHLWQSVDRVELIDELARRDPGSNVLVQINLSGEPQKGGCEWSELDGLVEHAAARGLAVHGLMGVAPQGPPALARPGFEQLVAAADRLGLPERSIGMTADLEVAAACGSTMVRVGRDLFGERPAR